MPAPPPLIIFDQQRVVTDPDTVPVAMQHPVFDRMPVIQIGRRARRLVGEHRLAIIGVHCRDQIDPSASHSSTLKPRSASMCGLT